MLKIALAGAAAAASIVGLTPAMADIAPYTPSTATPQQLKDWCNAAPTQCDAYTTIYQAAYEAAYKGMQAAQQYKNQYWEPSGNVAWCLRYAYCMTAHDWPKVAAGFAANKAATAVKTTTGGGLAALGTTEALNSVKAQYLNAYNAVYAAHPEIPVASRWPANTGRTPEQNRYTAGVTAAYNPSSAAAKVYYEAADTSYKNVGPNAWAEEPTPKPIAGAERYFRVGGTLIPYYSRSPGTVTYHSYTDSIGRRYSYWR